MLNLYETICVKTKIRYIILWYRMVLVRNNHVVNNGSPEGQKE